MQIVYTRRLGSTREEELELRSADFTVIANLAMICGGVEFASHEGLATRSAVGRCAMSPGLFEQLRQIVEAYVAAGVAKSFTFQVFDETGDKVHLDLSRP